MYMSQVKATAVAMASGMILVKDLPAEKSQSSFAGLRTSNKPISALKGELLIAIPGDKLVPRRDRAKPHNYRLARDATVSLRAEPDDIAPLNRREFALLEAIKSNHIRYSIFLSELDWGLSLRKDSKVYVIVNPEAPQSAWVRSKAVVHWSGKLEDQQGTQFGVEITVCWAVVFSFKKRLSQVLQHGVCLQLQAARVGSFSLRKDRARATQVVGAVVLVVDTGIKFQGVYLLGFCII